MKGNPVWCDVLKMYYALDGDVCHFHSSEYLKEKLKQILIGTCYWHPKIEEHFKENVDADEARIKKVVTKNDANLPTMLHAPSEN